MELVRKLAAALARSLGNVFDDVPDTPKTVRNKPLTFHRAILITTPAGEFWGKTKTADSLPVM
jgi:hypothetical protein